MSASLLPPLTTLAHLLVVEHEHKAQQRPCARLVRPHELYQIVNSLLLISILIHNEPYQEVQHVPYDYHDGHLTPHHLRNGTTPPEDHCAAPGNCRELEKGEGGSVGVVRGKHSADTGGTNTGSS